MNWAIFFNLKKNNKQINIVHIGDSHLQSSAFPIILRTKFQSAFGNAGRGVIAPYHVAGISSPPDVFSSSDTYWDRWSLRNQDQLNGIAGITINTLKAKASFIFKVNKKYAFNQLVLFFENNEDNYDLLIEDLLYGQKVLVNKNMRIPGSQFIVIKFEHLTTRVKISNIKRIQKQRHTTIFGLNISNGEKGIIFHSIGVNGAQHQHYNKAQYFINGLSYLKPDLYIISLGTNEALRRSTDFNKVKIEEDIQDLIESLKKQNYEIVILVTIPANFYIAGMESIQIKTIREIIISYCKKNNIAYWDLQEITGSASNWSDNNLMSKDKLHFNKKGYELQGALLYQAFMDAYNQYLLKGTK